MHALVEGGFTPHGRVRVSGAKNSATRLLAGALLTGEEVELRNFPTQLVDVQHKVGFMRNLGATVLVNDRAETVTVNAEGLEPKRLTREQYDVPIRTTYLLAAAQLVRGYPARIPYPGGCPIGKETGGGRGYDFHIAVWEAFGCEVFEREDHIEVVAPQGLVGGKVNFPQTTVGGTENALLCAAVASGSTEITNAYVTPEVEDLIRLLRRMGAHISLFGSSRIVVRGANGLLSGAHQKVMPDRIEALTWITYAVLAGGELTVEGVPFDSMESPLMHLEHAGVDLFRNSTSVRVSPDCLTSGFVQPFEVACGAYPGVISDMQPFFTLLGLAAHGTSRVYDYRYPDRIAFARELARFTGPDTIEYERGTIVTRGPAPFHPARANSTDLRGSMAVMLAALSAPGISRIDNVQMALRGYNGLAEKLRSVGAKLEVFEGARS